MRSLPACTLCLLMLGLSAVLSGRAAQTTAIDVIHYKARVEPHIAEQTIRGTVTIRLALARPESRALPEASSVIELDSGPLAIDAVRERGRALRFSTAERRLRIDLPRASAAGEEHEIEIEYHGGAASGLQFFPDRLQVYTVFSTSHWMPSVSAPGDKASLDLEIVVPSGLTVAASGELVRRRTLAGGEVSYEWRQRQPVPSYTFGFVAGRFTDVDEERGGRRFRYLGSSLSADELKRVFRDTPDMMAFFEERAGVRYALPAYTQALVARTIGQEMNGLSILSDDYGRAVLADERVLSLIAHELAHQWWGNGVTCREFTDFWLNEGIVTFMAAAYVERRFGRDAYLKAMGDSRQRYERVREPGHDRPLVFPEWTRPTADDRTLVYHKGAYMLHRLREQLGDEAFWNGMREYTKTFMGRSVVTADFERAMEQSAGRDLSSFFSPWVR